MSDRYDDDRIPVLRVASGSDCKAMATAVERRVMNYQAVKLEAVGAGSVNQAVKAVAVARTNLELEGKGLAFYPEFIHIPSRDSNQPERSALQFYAFSTPPTRIIFPRRDEESPLLKVSAKSDVKAMSTTLAGRLRTSGVVRLQAVGPGSVNQAAKALAIARRTIDEGSDIVAIPEFVHIPAPTPAEGERSAVRLTLFFKSERLRRRRDDRYEERWEEYEERRDDRRREDRRDDRRRDDRGRDDRRDTNDRYERNSPPSERYDRDRPKRNNSRGSPKPPPRQVKDSARPPPKERPNPPPQSDGKSIAKPQTPPYRADITDDIQELRVSGKSDSKNVAGAIAARLRQGNPVRITVMGSSCVNVLVKAVAVARTYLEEDRADIAAYVNFTHLPGATEEEQQRSAIQAVLYLSKEHRYDEQKVSEFKVAGTTKPKSTAGAIANGIRSGKLCKLEALGPAAVNQALKAIAIGRLNLKDNDIDIYFIPNFRTLELSNGRRSALELLVLPVSNPTKS